MDKDFTVVLTGKSGRFSTRLKDELDFAVHPCEVCLQEMVYTPGSWGNVRSKSNYLTAFNRETDHSHTLFLPPRHYASLSDLLYGVNEILINQYGPLCDLFHYCDKNNPKSKLVMPLPTDIPNHIYIKKLTRKFAIAGVQLNPILEEVGMQLPLEILYGGGKDIKVSIIFCVELALLLGIVDGIDKPVPAILPGWSTPRANTNINKNNLKMMWVYSNFVETTMLGTHRGPLLKIIPVIDDIKTASHAVFNTEDFVAVQKRRVQEMEVWMLEGPGSDAALPIDEEVVLILYFRPLNVLPPNHH